jgi:hypothetical protein
LCSYSIRTTSQGTVLLCGGGHLVCIINNHIKHAHKTQQTHTPRRAHNTYYNRIFASITAHTEYTSNIIIINMDDSLTVCIASPIDIDEGVFRAWTYGLTQSEALALKVKENITFTGFNFRNQFKKPEFEASVRELFRLPKYSRDLFDVLNLSHL